MIVHADPPAAGHLECCQDDQAEVAAERLSDAAIHDGQVAAAAE
jgi:hypothetical protein